MRRPATPSSRLTAHDPFVVHLQFRLPLWRIQRGYRRIAAALHRSRLPGTVLTITLADEVFATISLPGGTIQQALRGEPPATAALQTACQLADTLKDLDPVIVDAPGPAPVINTSFNDLGHHHVARVIRHGYTTFTTSEVSA